MRNVWRVKRSHCGGVVVAFCFDSGHNYEFSRSVRFVLDTACALHYWSVTKREQHAQESEPTMSKNLGKAEQALYERLRCGPMTAGESSFFSRQISALVAARIARRTQEGGVELVNPASYATAPPPASLSSAPPASQSGEHSVMPTVTARVPQDVIDYADAIREPNESRGSALRRLLGAAVERGLCKPATLRKAGGV